jgi:hypothetical protein
VTEAAMTRTGAYQPRDVGFLKLHETAGWRLKFYGITVEGGPPRPELVTVAEALAPSVLPSPAVHSGGDDPHDVDRYGVGFVILHDAKDYAFALFDKGPDIEAYLEARLEAGPEDRHARDEG